MRVRLDAVRPGPARARSPLAGVARPRLHAARLFDWTSATCARKADVAAHGGASGGPSSPTRGPTSSRGSTSRRRLRRSRRFGRVCGGSLSFAVLGSRTPRSADSPAIADTSQPARPPSESGALVGGAATPGVRDPAPPRVARLRALERQPPSWLMTAIGEPPAGREKSVTHLLRWRRAALALDDYRRRRGEVRHRALESLPDHPRLASMHCAAWRAVHRYRDELRRGRDGRPRFATASPSVAGSRDDA